MLRKKKYMRENAYPYLKTLLNRVDELKIMNYRTQINDDSVEIKVNEILQERYSWYHSFSDYSPYKETIIQIVMQYCDYLTRDELNNSGQLNEPFIKKILQLLNTYLINGIYTIDDIWSFNLNKEMEFINNDVKAEGKYDLFYYSKYQKMYNDDMTMLEVTTANKLSENKRLFFKDKNEKENILWYVPYSQIQEIMSNIEKLRQRLMLIIQDYDDIYRNSLTDQNGKDITISERRAIEKEEQKQKIKGIRNIPGAIILNKGKRFKDDIIYFEELYNNPEKIEMFCREWGFRWLGFSYIENGIEMKQKWGVTGTEVYTDYNNQIQSRDKYGWYNEPEQYSNVMWKNYQNIRTGFAEAQAFSYSVPGNTTELMLGLNGLDGLIIVAKYVNGQIIPLI